MKTRIYLFALNVDIRNHNINNGFVPQFCSAPSSADQKRSQANNYQRFTITRADPSPEFLPALPGFF